MKTLYSPALACLLFLPFASRAQGAIITFSGTARNLDGKVFDTFDTLQVQILDERGNPIGRPSALNVPQATYTVTLDDAILATRTKSVSLVFTAVGRETVTLDNILGTINQTVNVVLPEKKESVCYPTLYPYTSFRGAYCRQIFGGRRGGILFCR
jgi:hypothetical protein